MHELSQLLFIQDDHWLDITGKSKIPVKTDGAQPTFIKPQQIPYALLPKVEYELEGLEKAGNITTDYFFLDIKYLLERKKSYLYIIHHLMCFSIMLH